MRRIYILAAITLVSLLVVNSCSPARERAILGRWHLVSYTDPFKATLEPTLVSEDEIYTLRLDDTYGFVFNTDCNTISGEYAVTGEKIHFINPSVTEMACDKEIVERCVKSQLTSVNSYSLPNDSTLCLLGRQGNVLFKFFKAGLSE